MHLRILDVHFCDVSVPSLRSACPCLLASSAWQLPCWIPPLVSLPLLCLTSQCHSLTSLCPPVFCHHGMQGFIILLTCLLFSLGIPLLSSTNYIHTGSLVFAHIQSLSHLSEPPPVLREMLFPMHILSGFSYPSSHFQMTFPESTYLWKYSLFFSKHNRLFMFYKSAHSLDCLLFNCLLPVYFTSCLREQDRNCVFGFSDHFVHGSQCTAWPRVGPQCLTVEWISTNWSRIYQYQ